MPQSGKGESSLKIHDCTCTLPSFPQERCTIDIHALVSQKCLIYRLKQRLHGPQSWIVCLHYRMWVKEVSDMLKERCTCTCIQATEKIFHQYCIYDPITNKMEKYINLV